MSLLKFTATTTPTPLNSTCNLLQGDAAGYAILATCTGSPSSQTTADVFQHGCLMYQTDSGSGVAAIYQNTGTTAVPSWVLMDTASTSLQLPEASTDASTTTGTSLALTMNTVTTGNGLTISATGLTTGKALSLTTSSSSTNGSTSVEPILMSNTMTGAGGVGGRARFYMTTNVALGAWSNALKGEVTYGASGSTSGLGSSILAEMTLSAGTSSGTYAPLELELNLGTGASTGTQTSLLYGSVNGADASTFDTNGFIMSLNGLSAGASNAFRTGLTAATINAATTAALRINVGGTTYYIPLATATA